MANLVTDLDRRLLLRLEQGLPLVPEPYAAIARDLGVDEALVLDRLSALQANGTISRFGVVVRHRELGYRANAMVVWDVPDAEVSAVGRRLSAVPFVTLCYRRPRRPPRWPFNLFCMIHGRSQSEVLAQVDQAAELAGLSGRHHRVLFSERRFKQRGANYGGVDGEIEWRRAAS